MPPYRSFISKPHPLSRTNASFVFHIRQPLNATQTKTRCRSSDRIVRESAGGLGWGVKAVMQDEPDGIGRDVRALELWEGHDPCDLGDEVGCAGVDEPDEPCDDGAIGTMASLVEDDKEKSAGVLADEILNQFGETSGGSEWFYGLIGEHLWVGCKCCDDAFSVECGLNIYQYK